MNKINVAKAHELLSRHPLVENQQGRFRTQNMFVSTPDGRIEYVAASPYEVAKEMVKLYKDMATLLKKELTMPEVFFYAAMIHLVFVEIHPWVTATGAVPGFSKNGF